jgi:4-amino-4-deoxy-L-arabinose transferase-like glycosyltransferase
MFNKLSQFGERSVFDIQWKHWILFLLILSLGTFSRLWDFNHLPPGLNADEASIGVDAFNLYHYGMDRNGISFPVDFISWGSGQNALYGYILIPFVAVFGLSPAVVRLPMLICGILTLPLMFWVGRKTFDIRFGLLSMFFLAICPWHILLSRWGLESNIFPFIFILGYTFILHAEKSPGSFIVACLFFGLSLYCYGTAYAMVPIFLICVTIIFLRTKTFTFKELIPGLIVFAVISTPILLFIYINFFGINSVKLAAFTIPRLPVSARFETETVIFNASPIQGMFQNGLSTIRLLLFQSDGLI